MKEYTHIGAMEPMVPEENRGALEGLAEELIRSASALGASMHPTTRLAMADLLRPMNSYYSNLIEGHDTHPIDIERALAEVYHEDKKKRDLQLEAKAHILLHKAIHDDYLEADKPAHPSHSTYLRQVHADFFDHLPEDFKIILGKDDISRNLVPGEYRTCSIEVGRHIGPSHERLDDFMTRFEAAYDPSSSANRSLIDRIINIAASHHRLVWIHPFLDGNGRVVRLFSDACFMYEKLDANGLWSISRGLARSPESYRERLANADMPRMGDLDGRGNLSNRMLVEFCSYFLETAIDQITFMHNAFQLDTILERLEHFVIRATSKGKLRAEAVYVLQEAFLKGSVSRQDAERLCGLSDKVSKAITDSLIALGLLEPRKEGKMIVFYPKYPISISPWILPELYPSSKETEMMLAL